MQTEALVALTPENLVALILKKQHALAKDLPDLLAVREEELSRAYILAKEARAVLTQLKAAELTDTLALAKAEGVYNEQEDFRRRSESRTHQLRNANANIQSTLAYWSNEQRPWMSLLEAAQRVAEGQPPMFATKATEGGRSS